MTTIGVAIPSIPPRAAMLSRALQSVLAQSRPADQIVVAVDQEHRGAAYTRNRAWWSLDTAWVAFLDDDDELNVDHLQRLIDHAEAADADLVYPWFDVVGGTDPFPHHFGVPWDPAEPHQTTITCLWRRSALEKVEGFPDAGDGELVDENGNRIGEDYLAVRRLNDLGGRIVHHPARTWRWHHHFANTSGRPDRW